MAYKVAGAAAERGDALDAVASAARSLLESTRTMGVGLSPTILPALGKPTFELGEGEMEIGIGIHGERGVRRTELATADAIADELFSAVVEELSLQPADRVSVMVNGMGATPLEELYIVYRRVAERLEGMEVSVHRADIGEFATSLEMSGASLTIVRLDDQAIELLDAPASSPFFRR